MAEIARRSPQVQLVVNIGAGLMGLALLWWFLYYAQWEGAFKLLGLKWLCITGATMECEFFQEQLTEAGVGIPTYSPLLWWAGVALVVVGFFISRRKAAQ